MPPRLELSGEIIEPLPDRALWWHARRTLLVADLHLGKPAAFRAAGIPAPESTTGADLARLARLIAATGADRLVVLGDLLHARTGRSTGVIERVVEWRRDHRALDILLVRGNHDRSSGDPPDEWHIGCADAPTIDGPFELRHEPPNERDTRRGFALCGHIHPAISLDAGPGALRAPCFWFGESVGVLPAFGSFTGARTIVPSPGDRVFAASAEGVIDVSHAFTPRRMPRADDESPARAGRTPRMHR